MNDERIERYSRQLLVPGFGEEAQDRLARARVRVVGADAVASAGLVFLVQAGVGRHVFDDRPEFARQALEQIESVGCVALGELDAVLRVLRPSDGEPRAEPETTTLAGLDALCERIRATGREVRLEVESVELTPTAERAAYRIVQEALTNAAKHGGGRADVAVRPGPDAVEISVTNPTRRTDGGRPAAGGHGIVGMRERASLLGGTLETTERGGTFRLHARLPLHGARP